MDRWSWRNPRHVFPILAVVALESSVIFWKLQTEHRGIDLSLPYNVSLGALTAFLGAAIALWVYSYLSLESQRRGWQHDLEVKHFEEIYGPLYVDTKKVVEGLRKYERPHLGQWRDIHEGKFGLFVDEKITNGMTALSARLDDYNNVAYRTEVAAESFFAEFAGRHRRTAGLNKTDRDSLWANLRDDHEFLYNPHTPLPLSARVENITKILPRTEGTDVTVDEAKLFLGDLKAGLLENPAVKERIAECERLLPEAERVFELISRRMRDPFRQASGPDPVKTR